MSVAISPVFRELQSPIKRSKREMRQLILKAEQAIAAIPGHLTAKDFETYHHFHKGIYAREVRIPKGTLVTGRIHKFSHLNMLTLGSIVVWTEQGMKYLHAPSVIKSEKGLKRIGYAITDCAWTTVHENPSNEVDLEKVEDRLFCDTFEEGYLASERTFDDAIAYLGFDALEVKLLSENNDRIDILLENLEIRESVIHGLGIFAQTDFKAGNLLGMAMIGGKRTQLGRYCNHSGKPNSEMRLIDNGRVELIAKIDIKSGDEILNDYYFSFEGTRRLFLCPR